MKTLIFMTLVLVVSGVSAGSKITIIKAMDMIEKLPEVKYWRKCIKSVGKGKVLSRLGYWSDKPELEKGKKYFSLNFYEDRVPEKGPGANNGSLAHRIQTFLVRLDGKEILVDDVINATYISVREWRARQNPMKYCILKK